MIADFIWQRRVGFGDCDPAGIAYTGRIVDFALEALDVFWEHVLDGEGWFAMNVGKGYGMPFVRVACDFMRPILPPHPLDCHVRPLRLGSTSVTMRVLGTQAGETVFEAGTVSVFVDMVGKAKMPVPAHVRLALEPWLDGEP